ncbi:MAG: 2-phospho-L-lactate transferase CofD family protein, partial [Endomicrobium sp.]|nr:2-phospho-L-lactate transferase CofD family protein [Endomicrobium sp.]
MKILIKKSLSVLCGLALLLSIAPNTSYSIPFGGYPFNASLTSKLPRAKTTSYADYSSDLLVINIQDFHEDYNTQTIISDLLKLIDDSSDKSKEFYVEGAYSDVGLESYKKLKSLSSYKNFTDTLLKNNSITGTQHFALNNPSVVLRGLEDETIHKDNIKRLSFLIETRAENAAVFNAYSAKTAEEILKLLPAQCAKLIKLKSRYENAKIPRAVFARALIKYAAEQNLPEYKRKYPSFFACETAAALEKKINVKKTNEDLSKFYSFLKNRLPYKDYVKIENSNDKIEELGKLYASFQFRTPSLDVFFKYRKLKDSLNPVLLVEEEDFLFWEILASFADNTAQKRGASLLRTLSYAEKLIKQNILPYEYAALSEKDEDLRYAFGNFLKADLMESVLSYYNTAKEFYEINEKRNDIFIEKAGVARAQNNPSARNTAKNDFKEMLSKAAEIKILVTGGYHSRGLCDILNEKGVSYIVITPETTFGAENNAGSLYENSILSQGKIFSSALQKVIDLSGFIVENNALNIQRLGSVMFGDYELIKYLEKTPEALELYCGGVEEELNKRLSGAAKLKSVKSKISEKADGLYRVEIAVETSGGYGKSDIFEVSNRKSPVKTSFEKSVLPQDILEAAKALKAVENEADDFIGFFEFLAASQNGGDFILAAPEILKIFDEFYENVKKIYSLPKDALSDYERTVFEGDIKRASETFFNFSSGVLQKSFGIYSPKLYSRGVKLHKLLEENNVAVNPQRRGLFGEEKFYSYEMIKKRFDGALSQYFEKDAQNIAVLKYVSSSLNARDIDVRDAALNDAASGYFKKIFEGKNERLKRRAIEALQFQAEEIRAYFDAGGAGFSEEEAEDALIRSVSAVIFLARYGGGSFTQYFVSFSQDMFERLREGNTIKGKEKKYLSLLGDASSEDFAVEESKKELFEAISYTRKITLFQNALVKAVADSSNFGEGGKESGAYKAASDFFIKAAQGVAVKDFSNKEGAFWLRQQAMLRLKDFYSKEAETALNNIIESEKNGEFPSEDSSFVSLNLEASNTGALSFILQAASVLIDFKRQRAKNLLLSDIDGYFNALKSAETKDKFAYIAAASDVLSGDAGAKAKSEIFARFAKIDDEETVFSSNILLDCAENELFGKNASKEADAVINFIYNFVENSGVFGKKTSDAVSEKLLSALERKNFTSKRNDIISALNDVHTVLSNLGQGEKKNKNWLLQYDSVKISGGGTAEEILTTPDGIKPGRILSVTGAYDDGGSSGRLRGYNADHNGVYSVAQGDLTGYMTKVAFDANSPFVLKDVVKGLMNLRFAAEESQTEESSLAKAVGKFIYENNLRQAAKQKNASEEFEVFIEKLMYYCRLIDETNIKKAGNSVKNLIFEILVVQNYGYGRGFMNPDGIYAAMKDFADLLGIDSVSVTDVPFGNIMKVTTKGGVEYLGQSFFSHTPRGHRAFWDVQNISEVFDAITHKSKVAAPIENAKTIFAGLCSWTTSLGVALANPSVSRALFLNSTADKFLITNAVLDDENTMSWSESTVYFIQRVTGHFFNQMFNKVITWKRIDFDKNVGVRNLKARDIFNGALGGYRGPNFCSVSDEKLLAKHGVELIKIADALEIQSETRRDGNSQNIMRIRAIADKLSKTIWANINAGAGNALFAAMRKNFDKTGFFENSTVLFFASSAHSDAVEIISEISRDGANSFSFIPIDLKDLAGEKISQKLRPAQSYAHISSPKGFRLFFMQDETDGFKSVKCYYAPPEGLTGERQEEILARWFAAQSPFLLQDGLLANENVSIASSELGGDFFSEANFSGVPFIYETSAALSGGKEEFFDLIFSGIKQKIEIKYKTLKFLQEKLNWQNINADGSALERLRDFLADIDALDNPIKRAGMIYVLKHKLGARLKNEGIFFIDSHGRELLFHIDVNGKFSASDSYLKRMAKLAETLNFADMDNNIADRKERFSAQMREIFSRQALYGLTPINIITANTKESLALRFGDINKFILSLSGEIYTDSGAIKYQWDSAKADFVMDENHGIQVALDENLSQAARDAALNADEIFDDLYQLFIRETAQ